MSQQPALLQAAKVVLTHLASVSSWSPMPRKNVYRPCVRKLLQPSHRCWTAEGRRCGYGDTSKGALTACSRFFIQGKPAALPPLSAQQR